MGLIVLNHDEMVRMAAEALSASEGVRELMDLTTAKMNEVAVREGGEADAPVLTVLDVMSSLMMETMFEACNNDEDAMFVSAHAASNDEGRHRVAEFVNTMIASIERAAKHEGVIGWLKRGDVS